MEYSVIFVQFYFISSETMYKGLFTPSESGSESEKDQRTSGKDQVVSDKRNFSLSRSLSVDLNTAKVKPIRCNIEEDFI